MKRIYTFTLSSDDYPSDRQLYTDIRLIAYMLYETIHDFGDEKYCPLNTNKNIEYNNLNEFVGSYDGHEYKFDSDLYDDGYINYEPFMINHRTFALTICDDSFGVDIINDIVQEVLNLLKLSHYKIRINSIDYMAKSVDDERYRNRAIIQISDQLGLGYVRKRCPIRRFLNKCNRSRLT